MFRWAVALSKKLAIDVERFRYRTTHQKTEEYKGSIKPHLFAQTKLGTILNSIDTFHVGLQETGPESSTHWINFNEVPLQNGH